MTITNKIMRQMGFADDSNGPYVTELRALTARQVSNGLVGASLGTWSPINGALTGPIPPDEERARARLALNWEFAQGHAYRVETLDGPPWRRTFNCESMKYQFHFHSKRAMPWVRDQGRAFASKVRVFWSRKVLRKVNPYGRT